MKLCHFLSANFSQADTECIQGLLVFLKFCKILVSARFCGVFHAYTVSFAAFTMRTNQKAHIPLFTLSARHFSGVCWFCWNLDIFHPNAKKLGVQVPQKVTFEWAISMLPWRIQRLVSTHLGGGLFLAIQNSKCQVILTMQWGGGVYSWLIKTQSANQVLIKFSFWGGGRGGGGAGAGTLGTVDTTVLKSSNIWVGYICNKKNCTTCVESKEHLVTTLCNTRDITPHQLFCYDLGRLSGVCLPGLISADYLTKHSFVFRLLHLKTKRAICPN